MASVETSPSRGHGFWSSVGHQLRQPSGLAGRAIGVLMTVVNRQPVERAIDALNPMPGDRVLELGFGSGYGLERLASIPRIGKLCGIDHSETMVEAAARRNRAAVARGDMQLVCGDFRALPWEDDTFDRALLVNVVYFFGPDGEELREVSRVLKPGGMIVAYATAKSSMERWPFCEPVTHRLFDRQELAAMFALGGFSAETLSIEPVKLSFGIEGYMVVGQKDDPRVAGPR